MAASASRNLAPLVTATHEKLGYLLMRKGMWRKASQPSDSPLVVAVPLKALARTTFLSPMDSPALHRVAF